MNGNLDKAVDKAGSDSLSVEIGAEDLSDPSLLSLWFQLTFKTFSRLLLKKEELVDLRCNLAKVKCLNSLRDKNAVDPNPSLYYFGLLP